MGWRVRTTGKAHHTSDKEFKCEVPLALFAGLQVITDPGTGVAIPVDKGSGIVPIVTGGSGQTNTLALPAFVGQILILNLMTDGGGDRVVTVADPHLDGTNNTITLNDAGDFIMLIAVRTSTTALRWALVVNGGTTLSHV